MGVMRLLPPWELLKQGLGTRIRAWVGEVRPTAVHTDRKGDTEHGGQGPAATVSTDRLMALISATLSLSEGVELGEAWGHGCNIPCTHAFRGAREARQGSGWLGWP